MKVAAVGVIAPFTVGPAASAFTLNEYEAAATGFFKEAVVGLSEKAPASISTVYVLPAVDQARAVVVAVLVAAGFYRHIAFVLLCA